MGTGATQHATKTGGAGGGGVSRCDARAADAGMLLPHQALRVDPRQRVRVRVADASGSHTDANLARLWWRNDDVLDNCKCGDVQQEQARMR